MKWPALTLPGMRVACACEGVMFLRDKPDAVLATLEGAPLSLRMSARIKWLPFPRVVIDVQRVELRAE